MNVAVADELTRAFHASGDEGRLAFDVELPGKQDLYRLMDFLRGTGAEVESIERTTVQFEQVFRRLVSGAGRQPQAPAARAAVVEGAHVAG